MPLDFRGSTTFPYPWRETAIGVLHKYPNPQATHVVSMDVIDHKYDEETGLLRLERIMGVQQGAPRWIMKLIGGSDDTFVREVTLIDPKRETVEMTSTNMTVTNIMLVKEYITYTPLNPGNDPVPASPAATLFQQAASIQSRMKGMLGSTAGPKVESWSHSRFGDNAAKGKQGLMTVLNGLWGPPTSSAPAASEQ